MKHIYLLFVLALLFSCQQERKPLPVVKEGVIDLSQWNFEHDGNIQLSGEWELYWNELYQFSDFKDSIKPTGYTEVPGSWNYLYGSKEQLPGRGCCTYRMHVKTNLKTGEELALKLLDNSSAYRLYINDKLVASNGITSCNKDSMKAQYLPLVTRFIIPASEFDVIAQVSNNLHSKGGLWNPMLMGTEQKIMTTHNSSYIYNLFVIGLMFILFVYHIWIYLLRNSEKVALSFAALCFSMFIRTIFTGERFLYILFPSFSVAIGLKLEYIGLIGAGLSCGVFYYNLFPHDFSKKVLYTLVGCSVLEIISILFFPASFFTRFILIYQLCIIAIGIYMCMMMSMAAIRKRPGSISFLMIIFIMIASVINDILLNNLVIQSVPLTPYAFILFVLTQAYFLASRISVAFHSIESLSVNLEKQVEERTWQLNEEKKKSDDLLLNILPEEVADELKSKGSADPQLIDQVTVLFTDFKGFTQLAEKLTPKELVAEINACFSAFDHFMQRNGVEKIKTIGDAYMAAGGLPTPNSTHSLDVVRAALDVQQFMEEHQRKRKEEGKLLFEIRIGIHTGPVIAGIVGVKKFAYDIWGDTVNMASRMESSGEVGKVNISETTYELIKDKYRCVSRGKITAKGKGEIEMYFVEGLV